MVAREIPKSCISRPRVRVASSSFLFLAPTDTTTLFAVRVNLLLILWGNRFARIAAMFWRDLGRRRKTPRKRDTHRSAFVTVTRALKLDGAIKRPRVTKCTLFSQVSTHSIHYMQQVVTGTVVRQSWHHTSDTQNGKNKMSRLVRPEASQSTQSDQSAAFAGAPAQRFVKLNRPKSSLQSRDRGTGKARELFSSCRKQKS